MADRGQRVLQHALAAVGHVHVAAGQRRHVQLRGQRQQLPQARGIVLLAVQFHRQVRAATEHRLQPAALRRVGIRTGEPQREQAAMRAVGQARLYGRGVVRLRSWRSAVCRFRRAGAAPLPCGAFLRPVRAAGQARLYGAIRFP